MQITNFEKCPAVALTVGYGLMHTRTGAGTSGLPTTDEVTSVESVS